MNTPNTDSAGTEHARIIAAKAAYLKEPTGDTLSDILYALAPATVCVPAYLGDNGNDILPLTISPSEDVSLFVCFTDMEQATEQGLPEGAFVAELPFRDFCEQAVVAEMGFVIDPFNQPLNIFEKPDVCRDIHALLFPPPTVLDIVEVTAKKQAFLKNADKETTLAFLPALCHSQVYVPGTVILSDADHERFVKEVRESNELFQPNDPSRFKMDTVNIDGEEYITVYLHQGDVPDSDREGTAALPETAAVTEVHICMTRRYDMAELIEQHKEAKRIAGLVLDYQCATGSLLLNREWLKFLSTIPRENIRYEEKQDEA